MAGIDNNTVLYLRGNEYKDLSIYANSDGRTITNNGTAISQSGKFGQGIQLTNGHIMIPKGAYQIDWSTDFTIEWWEYILGTITSDSALFLNRSTTGTAQMGLLIGYTSGKAIYMGSTTWNGFSNVTIKDAEVNAWHHWAFVKKGTVWTMYKDGVQFWTATNSTVPGANDNGVTLGAWFDGSGTHTGYNAIISEFRLSNIARYSSGFTPQTHPYTSVAINMIEQKKSRINFSVTKGNANETVNKVDIVLNNNVIQTFTNGYDNIDYTIDESLCVTGSNNIEIRAYYYNNFYESYNCDYNKVVEKLPTQPTLPEVVNKLNEIKICYTASINSLCDILTSNNYEVSSNDKCMNKLIPKINEFTGVKQNLVNTLIAKGIECSTSNTFEELIIKVNELSLNPFSEWAQANCWLAAGSCTALPATTYAATAQAYKGKIYVIGGYGTTTSVRVYDPKYNTWATTGFAAMPTGRYGLDSTIIDDKIYCIGGYNNLTTNQVYDITNNKWTTLAVMPTGREYLTVDAVGTNIYAIGGSGSSTYLNTNQCYDTLTNTWTTKTTMTAAKYDHASGVIGTDIYCIAGYTGSIATTNYKYSTTTDTWTAMKAATGRRGACCNNIEDKLYYNHGSNASTTYYVNNYMYDPVANTWTTMTASASASKAKYRTSAVVNNMIFVFGGYNGSALNLVDCYIV